MRLDIHRTTTIAALLMALLLLGISPDAAAKKRKKKKPQNDPYAEYVWPPPPDPARIKLESVIRGRIDVEPKSGWGRILFGATPQSRYDFFTRPFAVEFDTEGRILVSDPGSSALLRIDQPNRIYDVLGTRGNVRLASPLGIDVGPDGTIYVADSGLQRAVALDAEGKILAIYGQEGSLTNPTDVAISPSTELLYVADSKSHTLSVFDTASGSLVRTLGGPGLGEGDFNFPTSLTFGPEGNLFVVDQLNSRVQVFDVEGEYLDEFGSLGIGFANFVRPKDVAVDEVGFIYVTDNAFNNVQLFDADFSLLTFVGAGGNGPGRFHGASGVAVQGKRFAVVDQLGRRVQVFRFIVPKES